MINRDNSISSRVKIGCRKEGRRTMLTDSYFDIPYKVVHYGSKMLQEHLEVMLMCYSPGVMDGDNVVIDVHCPSKAEMKLFTQSYNKLHPMKRGAKQVTTVRVDDGAVFQFLPLPTIPFKDAIFDTTNEIHVGGNGHLIWGDIISGGRIHSGERFQFNRVHSKTKIFRDGRLIFFDNQLLEPRKQHLEELLFFEGYTHQGTLLLVSPHAAALKEELDALLTEQFTDMSYGFTHCGPNAIMIRALGHTGEAMHDWLGNIGNMCWSYIKHSIGEAEEMQAEQPGVKQMTKPKRKLKKTAVSEPAKKTKRTPVKKGAPAKKAAPIEKGSVVKKGTAVKKGKPASNVMDTRKAPAKKKTVAIVRSLKPAPKKVSRVAKSR